MRDSLRVRRPGEPRLGPVEAGEGWIRLTPWTGEDALPVPLEVGRSGPRTEGGGAWMVETENALVLIVPRDDLVYAVVGPPDGRLVQTVAAKLPSPPSPSLTDRLGDAGRGLLDSFCLG